MNEISTQVRGPLILFDIIALVGVRCRHSEEKGAALKVTKAFLSLMLVGLAAVILPSLPSAKIFQCLHGVEPGMTMAGVMDALKNTVSEDEVIETEDGFCAALNDSDLFRHARYRFDNRGVLKQIELAIREVRGRDEVLKQLDRDYQLNLSHQATVLRDGVALSLDGNTLTIRDMVVRTARNEVKRGPTRYPAER